MEKMYNVIIVCSPFNSNMEIAGSLLLKLHVPYSKDLVTIKVNPNTLEYKDKKSANMRQFSITKDTDETKTLTFDFRINNVHEINIAGKDYEIKLLEISTVREENQCFPTFSFQVIEK